MSQFDPDLFLNTTIEGALDTRLVPFPAGDFDGRIEKMEVKASKKGDPMIVLTWKSDDPYVREITNRDASVMQYIVLDITEQGSLDLSKGKNVKLGQLRDALGQNSSAAWSPNMLVGGAGRITVSHDVLEDETIFATVNRVNKL